MGSAPVKGGLERERERQRMIEISSIRMTSVAEVKCVCVCVCMLCVPQKRYIPSSEEFKHEDSKRPVVC